MKKEQTIEESLEKMKILMNFKPGMTRTENEDLNEQWAAQSGMMGARADNTASKQPSERKVARQARGEDRRTDRQDRRSTFYRNKADGMSGSEARKLKRDDRRSDRTDRKNGLNIGTTNPADPADAIQPVSQGYSPCVNGINKLGCKSPIIGQVQQLLGLKPDGMFGPKTQSKLSELVPEFSKEFTDMDLPAIQSKLGGSSPRPTITGNVNPKDIKSASLATNPPKESIGSKPPTQPFSGKVPSKIAPPKSFIASKSPYQMGTNSQKPGLKLNQQSNEGAKNMAQGFVNESTISHKEMKRINKESRLNKKLGLV